jgi:hypothetical protein
VRTQYPWLPDTTTYGLSPVGGLYIPPNSCKRGVYRKIKKNIKISKERIVHGNW